LNIQLGPDEQNDLPVSRIAAGGVAWANADVAMPSTAAKPAAIPDFHEVKFDGLRVQLHKGGREVAILSRRGRDLAHQSGRVLERLLAVGPRAG
jgi:ATP-dependent DNA ligase